MSDRPIIGITVAHCSEELKTFPRDYYVKCIRAAGGIPILLPPIITQEEAKQSLDLVDGLLLTGGGDISPIFLGETPLIGIGECIPERDRSELLLTKIAIDQDKPILGICRGIQVLAIAAGGRIYQDIYTQFKTTLLHKQSVPRQYPWHEVKIEDNTKMSSCIQRPSIVVNSFHHQAVSELPTGFIYNALAPDGMIEGIEKIGAKFCLGVQWHPEAMEQEHHSFALFKAFVEACKQ